ncbi:MAG: sugar phosphate isomerase/epimerase [Pirellulales bacterium]
MTSPADSPRLSLSRRRWLQSTSAALAGGAALGLAPPAVAVDAAPVATAARPSFRYCLNTSTIRGQDVAVTDQIDIAAAAGYDAIELWIRDVAKYVEGGGSLPDLKQRIADAGLTVESSIGFCAWIVDDEQQRKEALETARRDMEMIAQLGGMRIAAPPVGATNQENLDLFAAAQRYRALLELGASIGVVPQLELWGFSKSLSRLGEVMFVAVESGHPQACVMPDVFHIYKGGSDFTGLNLLAGDAMHCFHMNDYPADPPRDKIGDADRVYPGDGVAPLGEILRGLHRCGFRGVLSLELFNREYWQQDPQLVANTGLRKMKESVAKAFAT